MRNVSSDWKINRRSPLFILSGQTKGGDTPQRKTATRSFNEKQSTLSNYY